MDDKAETSEQARHAAMAPVVLAPNYLLPCLHMVSCAAHWNVTGVRTMTSVHTHLHHECVGNAASILHGCIKDLDSLQRH